MVLQFKKQWLNKFFKKFSLHFSSTISSYLKKDGKDFVLEMNR